MSVCCTTNDKVWIESPAEKHPETACNNVENSHSIWENAKNICERNDKVEEQLTESANVYFMDISICPNFEEAADGYVIESYESISSADKRKDIQELSERETRESVKQCLVTNNDLKGDLSAVTENKMDPKKYKSERKPSCERRHFSLRRGEQQGISRSNPRRIDYGDKVLNVNLGPEKATIDSSVSTSRVYKRTDSEEQTVKPPVICGAASLRLQRLKKQLDDARRLREEHSTTDSYTGKKTRLPVIGSTSSSGIAVSRLNREGKPYSVPATSTSYGGHSAVGSGICPSDHLVGPVLTHQDRDKSLSVSLSSSSSGAHVATRSGNRSANCLADSVHPDRDNRPYSMSALSGTSNSVSSVTRSGTYLPDRPMVYKRQGDRPSDLIEAQVVGRMQETRNGMPTILASSTRNDSSNSRVELTAARRSRLFPKETSAVNLYTRRKDLQIDTPRQTILEADRSHEQLKRVSVSPHDDLRNVLRNKALSKRVCTEVKAIDRSGRTLESFEGGARKGVPLPVNQECRELVPANQWGRPHQSAVKGTVAAFVRPLERPLPSHRSKGGISKVSTRVQKQVRTAAPLLKSMCRKSNPVRTQTQRSSLEESKSKPDSVCTIISEAKIMSSEITKEESMDWETIEPEQVVQHVGELRKQSSFQTSASSDLANLCNPNVLPSKWFVIVDTNIFLSHLSLVENLRDSKDPTLGMPTLLVPWVVLNELDCLKGSNSNVRLKNPATRAINFVWRSLVSKHPRLEGQHPSEASNSTDVIADDSILQCCMKMQEMSERVVLLTNDHNLQNKALISGVECFSAKELQKKIAEHQLGVLPSDVGSLEKAEKKEINSFLSKLKDCMKLILEAVLYGEMKSAYGPLWESILARKPPLSLSDVFFCLLKHWVAVFGTVLPGNCKELFEKLKEKFIEQKTDSSWYTLEILVKVCCEVITNLPLHRYGEKMNEAVRTLNELNNICDKKTTVINCTANQSPSVIAAPSTVSSPSTSQIIFSDRGEEDRRSESGSCRSSKSNVSRGSSGGNVLSGAKSTGESFDDYLSLHASSLSDGASDISSADLEMDKGQRIVQHYLDEIFKKIATFCGLLCEMMGQVSCVPFDRPECFPTMEALQENMPVVFPCAHNLLHNIQRVLAVPVHDLSEEHPVIVQLYHTVKDSFPTTQPDIGPLLPLHILAYCTDDITRQSLERGVHQFEQFEAIFNKAVLFFMGRNRPCPLPTF